MHFYKKIVAFAIILLYNSYRLTFGRGKDAGINAFWKRVKTITENNGCTFKWIEKNTGIKAGTFGSWLSRGDTYPTIDKALKIANAFGVSVEYLMTGKEFVENKIDNNTIMNILNYLQNQDETNLHRIEGVLMALGFLSAGQLTQSKKRMVNG